MNRSKSIVLAFKEMQKLEKNTIPSSIFIAIIMAAMPFVNIWFTSKIIDLLTCNAKTSTLIFNIGLALIINLILFFLNNYIGDIQFVHKTLMYNNELKNIAEKLYKIEYSKLEDSDFKELIHKHAESQERVYSSFSTFAQMIRDFVYGIVTIVMSIILILPLFKIGFTSTGNTYFEKPIFLFSVIVSVIVMAVIILLIALKMNQNQFESENQYAILNKIYYYFLNLFSDYKTGKEIRLYKEQNIINDIATSKIVTDGENIMKKTALQCARSSSIVAILASIVGFGVYLFIGVKGILGLFSVGSLVLYCGSFLQIVKGVMKMTWTFGQTEKIIPLVNYYFEILNTSDEMTYGTKEIDLADNFDVEFKNVSFRYPNCETYALKNVNIKINSGEHYAIVGKNGSGKTTFIKLLCRLYDVSKGAILINGINIKEYTKDSIIRLYSVVFQDYKIFSLTAAQNIAASDDYDKAKLYDSFEKADIKERILKMANKENTYLYKDLDENGVEISGGEAQKLALTRALYKDASIVILDEPTASMDPISESSMYSRFNSFVENKTAIYISHRLSSCAFCDNIAVFDKAELVEIGTHKDLIKLNGKYAKLWKAQSEYFVK
jgi:ATP-binding cassette subfamily B protein